MLFSCFESNLGNICWKLLFLIKKAIISERSLELLWNLVFLNNFCHVQIQRNIFIRWKQILMFKAEIWTNINKNNLLPKISHIQLNFDLQLVWIIFGENLLKSFLFNQKSDYLKKNLRINLKFTISQQYLLCANLEEYFYLIKQLL